MPWQHCNSESNYQRQPQCLSTTDRFSPRPEPTAVFSDEPSIARLTSVSKREQEIAMDASILGQRHGHAIDEPYKAKIAAPQQETDNDLFTARPDPGKSI